MASKQQDIFLHIMPTANSLQTDIVGNFSGNNHSPDNHLKPCKKCSIAFQPDDTKWFWHSVWWEQIKLSLHVSEFSTHVGNIAAQKAAEPGATSEDTISPLLLKGFPNYLSAARDQIDKYSGCEGYTQKDTPIDSTAIKTAEHNNPFMNDHTILHTNPAWTVSPWNLVHCLG